MQQFGGMMNIAIFGKYFSNAGHGAECGVVDALRELGHKIWIFDYPASKIQLANKTTLDFDGSDAEIKNFNFDFVLAIGPGLPPSITKNANIRNFFNRHKSIAWNSEPIRLKQYLDRLACQHTMFDLWATFDEGEVPIYHEHHMNAFFLPQAFNPEWYKPLDVAPEKFACFIGSVGGKWCNREHFVRRANAVLGDNFAAGAGLFDAKKVNEVYNSSAIVLNLGLHHEELGPPEMLASYAFQQRVFEAIGAGCVPMTNTPADLVFTPQQQNMFTNYRDIIYYDNETLEATLQFYMQNPEKLAEIHKNVLAIREEHTYEKRMEALIQKVITQKWS